MIPTANFRRHRYTFPPDCADTPVERRAYTRDVEFAHDEQVARIPDRGDTEGDAS